MQKIIKHVKTSKAIKFEFKDGKKTVGRAFLYLVKNGLHQQPYGLMEDVFVDENYRKQGLGSKLIDAVMKESKKQKCYKLIATSRMERESIHKYYEKFGFKKHGYEFRMNI